MAGIIGDIVSSGSKRLALIILLCFCNSPAIADANRKNRPRNEPIQLEAGIIKGRRLRPKIFLEFESHAPSVKAVLFKRTDFLDFHKEDVKVRLKYIRTKAR